MNQKRHYKYFSKCVTCEIVYPVYKTRCDEANAQEHDIQRYWNRICDGRKSIVANGKTYKLNKGCKLSITWT